MTIGRRHPWWCRFEGELAIDRIMVAVEYSYISNDEGAAFVGAAPISDADKAKLFSLPRQSSAPSFDMKDAREVVMIETKDAGVEFSNGRAGS